MANSVLVWLLYLVEVVRRKSVGGSQLHDVVLTYTISLCLRLSRGDIYVGTVCQVY